MKNLPVSKKVYADISLRINSSLGNAPQSAAEALRIVNDYLDGQQAESPDPMAMLAFNMIRAELDRAILRSRRARDRAKARKATPVPTHKYTPEQLADIIVSQLTPEEMKGLRSLTPPPHASSPATAPAPLPLSRRQRREAKRGKKARWKPLA